MPQTRIQQEIGLKAGPQEVAKFAPTAADLEYADQGLAEHKDAKHHLDADWHKGKEAPAVVDVEDRQQRLHELFQHVRLGLVANQALAAAARAVAAWKAGWDYTTFSGLAEHKGTKGHLAPYWRKNYVEPAEDYEDEEARLHELEEQARLAMAAQEAVVAAAKAVDAWNSGWNYQTEGGLAEHKDSVHHLAEYWRTGYVEPAEDYADESARLQELIDHARLAAEAQKAIQAALCYMEGWGYSDKGLAEHKDSKHHLAEYWHPEYLEPAEDYEDEKFRLQELVDKAMAAQQAVAAATAAIQGWSQGFDYVAEAGLAEHKGTKGHLAPYWRKTYVEPAEDYEDEEARLHELEEHAIA